MLDGMERESYHIGRYLPWYLSLNIQRILVEQIAAFWVFYIWTARLVLKIAVILLKYAIFEGVFLC